MAGIIGSALGTQTGGTPKPGQVTDQMQSDWGSYFSGARREIPPIGAAAR